MHARITKSNTEPFTVDARNYINVHSVKSPTTLLRRACSRNRRNGRNVKDLIIRVSVFLVLITIALIVVVVAL